MTIQQLQDSVAALGFENDIIDKDLFFASVKRALSLIFTDCEITRTVKLSKENGNVLTHIPKHLHEGGEVSFPLYGRAYSFTTSGTGKCTVRDGYEERTFEFSGGMAEHRGLINGEGEITFSGNFSYAVYDLVCYRSRLSDDPADVPIFSDEGFIDFAKIYGDFLSFCEIPKDSEGRSISASVLSEGKIYLPRDFSGIFTVKYRRRSHDINRDNITDVIDIPNEFECLLPLLTSSFMWLDDDADRAQYYMALYRDMLVSIMSNMRRSLDAVYHTNGWA